MIKDRNIANDAFISPTKIASFGAAGIGETFYVVRSADTALLHWLQSRVPADHLFEASTGSADVAINAALNECLENRNDYVIVMPSNSDYDMTSVISCSKKCVHLVAPAGLGYSRGATNAVRLEQLTAATSVFAVSDSSVEIAGFYAKPYASSGTGASHVTVAATSYALNIHHNHFVLKTGATNAASVACTGDGGAWGQVVHHNLFESQAGDDRTTAAMITVGGPATAARVDYNDFFIGDGNTYTVVIQNLATKGSVNYNDFMAAGSDATMTHCIQIGSYGCAIGNRGAVGDGAIITGGAADITNIDNMNAVDGGTIDDLD